MGFLHWPVYLVGLGGEEGNSALLTYCTHLRALAQLPCSPAFPARCSTGPRQCLGHGTQSDPASLRTLCVGEATGNVSDCQRMTAVIAAYMNMTSRPHNHMESRAVSHTVNYSHTHSAWYQNPWIHAHAPKVSMSVSTLFEVCRGRVWVLD